MAAALLLGMTMREIPKVAILFETARDYGRGVLRGIVHYARLHGPWSFYLTPRDIALALPKMRQWGGTGIIARLEDPQITRAVLRCRLPTVALDLSERQLKSSHPCSRLSELASDSHEAARLATNHLLQRRFEFYGFVGDGRVWSNRREKIFRELVEEASFNPHVYPLPGRKEDRSWEFEQSRLASWLAELPKPVGLLAATDDRGRDVLEACHTAGLHVPEEVGVIGIDNDELLCEVADPPLSSVAFNTERGGFQAAALLDQMMRGRVRKPQHLLVSTHGVITRRSTDIVALDDPEVAMAVRFIRDNISRPIGVSDVVSHVQLSRRSLELRFQKAIGRTMHAEIQRARFERAKRLLRESGLAVSKISDLAGYGTPSYMGQVFKRQLTMTPAQYRRHVRGE